MSVIHDFFRLFFPQNCLACAETLRGNESYICSHCFIHLPLTNSYSPFHVSEIQKIFWGKADIKHVCAYMYFSKQGIVQQLLHQLKYKGEKDLGVFLGEMFGKELCQYEYYSQIDGIIPIPLHTSKQKIRGYNQSEEIAKGLASALQKPVITNAIKRVRHTETQTKKSRFNRWKNVNDIFQVTHPELIKNKHLLIVDDVITTGSTIEACAAKLLDIEGVQVSVAGLAVAIN